MTQWHTYTHTYYDIHTKHSHKNVHKKQVNIEIHGEEQTQWQTIANLKKRHIKHKNSIEREENKN